MIDSFANGESPKALGFVMPPEWSAQEAVFLSWPSNPETWPGVFRRVEEAYAALLSLSLFRRACTQTEQAAGSGHTEREIPAKALCAESAKAGKTEETERSGGFGCIGREKAAVTAEANLAEIGASV